MIGDDALGILELQAHSSASCRKEFAHLGRPQLTCRPFEHSHT